MKIKRRYRHLTPRYVINKLSLMLFEANNPNLPWLTKDAIRILSSLIKDQDIALEFGSGRSTIWFAKKIKFLTSIEHDHVWYKKIMKDLQHNNLMDRVSYNFMSDREQYLSILNKFENNSVDFALIDGIFRDEISVRIVPKIKNNGFLIVDNINRYMPMASTISPDSRKLGDGFENANWHEFNEQVKTWRFIWTSNGVTDTGIWIK